MSYWFPVKHPPFSMGARFGAIGFSHNGKAYIGFGKRSRVIPSIKTDFPADLWEFDPVTENFTKLWDAADTPKTFGPGDRILGTGFGIEGTSSIYILTGYGSKSVGYLKDCWEFDTIYKTWTRLPDLPFHRRREAVAFSIGKKGYIGTGLGDNTLTTVQAFDDFWEFDWIEYQKTIMINSTSKRYWKQLEDYLPGKRYAAEGFRLGNNGYIAGGYERVVQSDGTEIAPVRKDVAYFNPVKGKWKRIKSLPEPAPSNEGVGFGIPGSGTFIGTGGGHVNDFYFNVNPADNNEWKKAQIAQRNSAGTPLGRNQAVGFSIEVTTGGIKQVRAYIGLGTHLFDKGRIGMLSDFWRLVP